MKMVNYLLKSEQENRDYVNYEDIPDLVEEAFLATEDSRFYEHHGVDFLRLGSAVIANCQKRIRLRGCKYIDPAGYQAFLFNA